MSTWLQMLNKNDSRLTWVPSSGNTSTHVRWEGPKKSISGPLLSVAFPFPLFNLFEGFCFSGHFQERKPLFFHAPSSWSESEGQPHLHILWAIAHARVTESRGLGLETLGDHRAGQDAGLTRVASRGGTRRGHQLARLGRTISIPRVPSPSLRSLLAPPPHCGGGAGAQPRPRGLPSGTLPLDE